MSEPLSDVAIERVLSRAPGLKIGVLGDLFLDRYLDLDASLTEVSLETGLDAYQVMGVRPTPGAAGTILNNLVALGVGAVYPLAVIGDDGEGYELRQALARMKTVDAGFVFSFLGRRTPTYTKPMLHAPGQPARELNRLDIHNRSPLPAEAEQILLDSLDKLWPSLDSLLVLDQVSQPDCGVVTARVRAALAERTGPFVLADSRERIGLFRGVCIKPNVRECSRALGLPESTDPRTLAAEMARGAGRAAFCTLGERGQVLAVPAGEGINLQEIPSYPVQGPTDTVGAGDSTSAGIACAVAAGLSLPQAAAFGNLVASITVAQLGTTGTASPEQVRARWRQVSAGR
jgi:bifunctional ADP-heptose synthase (sugar kinase/adenylyltransferase)